MWDFLKKLGRKDKEGQGAPAVKERADKPAWPAAPPPAPAAPRDAQPAAPAAQAAPKPEKPHAEKTDDELAEELNRISPGVLSQAKDPKTRKLLLGIYRGMLVDGVDVNNENEVKKWLKKHPEAAGGGDVQRVETVKRAEPKVGRNDPCPCGSGKKHKKCCGQAQ